MRITSRQLRQIIREELYRGIYEADETQASMTKAPPVDFPPLAKYAKITLEHTTPPPPERVLSKQGILVFVVDVKTGKLRLDHWLGDDGTKQKFFQLKAPYTPNDNPVSVTSRLDKGGSVSDPPMQGMEQGGEYSIRVRTRTDGSTTYIEPISAA